MKEVDSLTWQFIVKVEQNCTWGMSTSTWVLVARVEEKPLTWMTGYSLVDRSPPNMRQPTKGWVVPV